MPTYDYECTECGYIFEKFQSMKETPLKECPKCDGRVKRHIGTGSGIIFKGSGFYTTDYRSESYKKDAKKEDKPKGKKDESKTNKNNKKSD